MPRNQSLRRLLWRLSVVLAVCVCALAARILFVPVVKAPLPEYTCDWGEVGPRAPKASVDREEMARECSRFWTMGPPRERAAPRPVEAPTRPPLGAYDVRMWVRRPGLPDGVLLMCKDPAHPEHFTPVEGRPDRGVSLEGIRVEGSVVWIRVAREDETFTYRFLSAPEPDPRLVRIGASARQKPENGQEPTDTGPYVGVGTGAPIALRGLKCVPFFGSDGHVAGLRVVGVRPGSRFETMGLKRNDVVVRCGGSKVGGHQDLARHASGCASLELTVLRGEDDGTGEVELSGA